MKLTIERLREVLHYNPKTGIWTWEKHTRRTDKIGKIAGCLCVRDGYIIMSVDNRRYGAHRLAWFYMTGQWPKVFMDHKNRVRSDNRWCNLREATNAENCRNSSRKKGRSGFKGVTLYHAHRRQKLAKPFAATIMVNYRPIRLGYFATAEEAYAAYVAGAKKYHSNFASIT